MNSPRLLRAELRKLTTTRMPWVFAAILVAIATINAVAVAFGTEMDGSKAFIATAADQQSLMAFAANAFMGAALFGAVAVAREYGHHTVVPTYLATPRRSRALTAQYAAVAIAGAGLSIIGAALTINAIAIALPTTEYGFLVSVGGVTRVVAASAFAGACGAVFGGGIGAFVRNTGGAVATTVLLLIIAPPLVIQLASDTANWIPNALANVISGTAFEISTAAALAGLVAWALLPAGIGLVAVHRRDVV
jgi:ABC-type transport system involved in multi-copper enzyme maturation permease subunit